MGLLRPVVLLPLGFFAHLDPIAAEAVLAHELAHLRRLDGLVNGLQCLIEVLFFFHPAVWWLSSRIRAEREHCCDDVAVRACGDALFYAETLSRLDELRAPSASLALQARGGNLMERLRRLLVSDPPQLRFSTPSLGFIVALVLVGSIPAQAGKLKKQPDLTEETLHEAGPLRNSIPKASSLDPHQPAWPDPIQKIPVLPVAEYRALELPAAPGPLVDSVPTPNPQPNSQAGQLKEISSKVGAQDRSPSSMGTQPTNGMKLSVPDDKPREKSTARDLKLGSEVCVPDHPVMWKSMGDKTQWLNRPLIPIPPLVKLPKQVRLDASSLAVELNGTAQSISTQSGKVVVICFVLRNCWASLRAMDFIEHLKTVQKRDDMVFLFLNKVPTGGEAVFGPIKAFPMFYILDRKGRIAASFSGYKPELLTSLLDEQYLEAE
jgi:hypothetical protein